MLNIKVRAKPPLESLAGAQTAIKEAKAALSGSGTVIVRYSGTEPLCRVTVEGRDRVVIEQQAQRIADIIQKQIGAA
jgi:phosphoglucosamine mutase